MLELVLNEGPLERKALAAALRRWRLLHRVKQSHAAELLRVSQSTISRWEEGRQRIEVGEARKIEALVAVRLNSSGDAALRELVRESSREIHLICDVSHRLLSCSRSREASFSIHAADLMNQSLWRFSTRQVMEQEALLEAVGWHDSFAPAPVEFETGDNGVAVVPIRPSRCRWTRMTLSDGSAVRLVETLQPTELSDQRGKLA